MDEYPDGWAVSLNPRDLALYLPACPDDARVAAWCKTWHQIRPVDDLFPGTGGMSMTLLAPPLDFGGAA
jgi:hypothetical protein